MNFDPNLLGMRACDTQMGSHIWAHLDHRLESHTLSAEMCMAHMLHTNLDFISQRGGTISSGQAPQGMLRSLWPRGPCCATEHGLQTKDTIWYEF